MYECLGGLEQNCCCCSDSLTAQRAGPISPHQTVKHIPINGHFLDISASARYPILGRSPMDAEITFFKFILISLEHPVHYYYSRAAN